MKSPFPARGSQPCVGALCTLHARQPLPRLLGPVCLPHLAQPCSPLCGQSTGVGGGQPSRRSTATKLPVVCVLSAGPGQPCLVPGARAQQAKWCAPQGATARSMLSPQVSRLDGRVSGECRSRRGGPLVPRVNHAARRHGCRSGESV